LSPAAVQRLAELQGRKCYFFTQDIRNGLDSEFTAVTPEQAAKAIVFYAFDIPNPNEVMPLSRDRWEKMTEKQRKEHNALWRSHEIGDYGDCRNDANLVRVVQELGPAANGKHAKLEVVEIPNGVEWQIDDYDGRETVREKSREW